MPDRFLQNVNVTDAFARDSATKNVHLLLFSENIQLMADSAAVFPVLLFPINVVS